MRRSGQGRGRCQRPAGGQLEAGSWRRRGCELIFTGPPDPVLCFAPVSAPHFARSPPRPAWLLCRSRYRHLVAPAPRCYRPCAQCSANICGNGPNRTPGNHSSIHPSQRRRHRRCTRSGRWGFGNVRGGGPADTAHCRARSLPPPLYPSLRLPLLPRQAALQLQLQRRGLPPPVRCRPHVAPSADAAAPSVAALPVCARPLVPVLERRLG